MNQYERYKMKMKKFIPNCQLLYIRIYLLKNKDIDICCQFITQFFEITIIINDG